MSDRVTKEIYVDTEGVQLREYKNETFYSATPMTLHRGSQVLFRCNLMMADASTYFTPPTGATWLFGIDNVYTADHTDLVLTENANFNTAGDWDKLAVTGGYICWRVDLTTSALKTALGDLPSAKMYACLWMTPNAGYPTLMAAWDLTMNNIAVDPTTATAVAGITYPTTTVFVSAINQILTPTNGLYRIQNGALQLKNSTTGKFQTVSLSGASGSETIDYGPGED